MTPRHRRALIWVAHLCLVESDALTAVGAPEAQDVDATGEQAYQDAVAGLSETEAREAYRAAMREWVA